MANKMAWSALLFGMLIGGAMVMYQAQLTDAFLSPKGAGDPESNSRQRREIDYYDTDIDDDLEMHTTAYSSEASSTSTESPSSRSSSSKLSFDSKSPSKQASSPVETAHCVAPAQIDWTEKTEPKYKLDPEKYLIPALIWGPMNQVEGLRESIAIAIHLNRTLVLPPMYRHFTDPDGPNGVVDSKIRVDIPSIRELVSVIAYDALEPDIIPDSVLYARTIGFSNGQSGDILVASNSRLGRLNKFESATGYKVLNQHPNKPRKTEDFFGVSVTPKNASFDNDLRLQASSSEWSQIFGTDAKYSVLIFPYLTAKIETTHELGRDIMSHTLRPKFIHNMVDSFFQKENLPKTIVTIHYRFDEEDWERSCRRRRDTDLAHSARGDNRAKICNLLAHSSSDGLASSIASFLVELFSTNQIGDEVAFYIATPPQQQQVIKDTTVKTIEMVKQQLGHEIPVSGKSTADSMEYIGENYEGCDFVHENMHELSSLFEQEVCTRGQVFIFAPSSSWSGAVRRERHIGTEHRTQIDHSLLDILENYPKDETKLVEHALEERKLK